MNKDDEWAEGDYLDWLDYIDEELAQDPACPSHDPAYPAYPTQGTPNVGPASSKTAKLPQAKKKPAFNMPYDWDKEAKKVVEEKKRIKHLSQERMKQRVESAKRIKWKIIDKNYEYEVVVGGETLGKVKKSNGKWVVQPEFKWNEDSYRHRNLAKSNYGDFRESGHALVDLWCLS